MVDGVNPFSSAFANDFGQTVQESGPFWRAVSESQNTKDAGKGFMMWGSREFIGKQLDNAFGGAVVQNTKDVVSPSYFQKMFGFQTLDKIGSNNVITQRATDIALKDLKSVRGYVNKVRVNFEGVNSTFRQSLKNFSPKNYFKESIWEANKKPISEMMHGDKAKIGSGIARIVGLSFVGFEVASAGKKAYNDSKENGDGDMTVAAKTMGATAKQAAKSALSWEAAGVGMTLGRFLLPGIASVPLGGIALGVGFSLASRKLFDKADETITGAVMGNGKNDEQAIVQGERANIKQSVSLDNNSNGDLLNNRELFGLTATA